MKRFLIVSLLGLTVAATAFAAPAKKGAYMDSTEAPLGESPPGDSCGLGWQVTQKRTMLATTTRGTTNAVVPPSFGMTSGTIGCQQHSFAKKDQAAATYAMANIESLKLDMASGRGEYVDGLARLMGCNDSSLGAFRDMTRANYRSIVGGSSDSVQIFKNVKSEIGKNSALAFSCGA